MIKNIRNLQGSAIRRMNGNYTMVVFCICILPGGTCRDRYLYFDRREDVIDEQCDRRSQGNAR